MSVGLLDVNMLVALAWPSHVHHRAAHAWFDENRTGGWATCPLTQCGFVRVSSNARIIPEAVEPIEALTLLGEMVTQDHHEFWSDAIPMTGETLPTNLLAGHGQVTDCYLLGLSIHNRGKLVTLDHRVAALLPSGTPHANLLEIVPVQDT
ncbi:MAG: ribonuclease VapC [Phycisphaerae bacterium]|nr:MAG: ribonuclease VapC [Phycisphaerae bacterium]